MAAKDSTPLGSVFGRLTVISEPFQIGKYKEWRVLCRCECVVEKTVMSRNLLKGLSRSCGCQKGSPGIPRIASRKHGHCSEGASSNTYERWRHAKARCIDPKCDSYPEYGGRGIKMCDRWLHSFENFLSDMGECPDGMSIDRFPDTNGNYEPGNCRWANPVQQANNRRSSRYIEAFGERLTIAEWSRKQGISHRAISNRLKNGWPTEKALTEPPVPQSERGFCAMRRKS